MEYWHCITRLRSAHTHKYTILGHMEVSLLLFACFISYSVLRFGGNGSGGRRSPLAWSDLVFIFTGAHAESTRSKESSALRLCFSLFLFFFVLFAQYTTVKQIINTHLVEIFGIGGWEARPGWVASFFFGFVLGVWRPGMG